MDKERIDGFRSAFAPGETLFWQVPAAARERMAFYSENLPRLFSEKITAVFAVSDHYALEFMRFLQGQGIRVPEDVQIIGFDDTLASRESVPALTTIHQDAALWARTAIRRLEALRCRHRSAGGAGGTGKHKEAAMSDFMRTLCKIAIPVTLQGMLQASFSIVDQIMIGQLGEAGIAAVGLCSNFTLIFSVMSGAVGTVAGILIAQFLGAEEHTEAWRSLDVSLVCGGVLAALFLLTAGGFPAQVLGLYTAPCGGGVLPHRGVLLSAHGGQHRPVRMAALQGTRRCPLLGKFWRGSGEHRAELSAHLRKAGCPRYGRYRCCHRHAGFPAFEPAFDLDRLCGLPSKGSGTPAHRGDLDTVGGRFMFIFRLQRRA